MTTLLHWWYVQAAQAPHAWTPNEEGSLAEEIVTWEIESSGNTVTFWPLLKVGESFFANYNMQAGALVLRETESNNSISPSGGCWGRRSNCAEGSRAPLVGKLNLWSCHTAVQPQTNDGRLRGCTNTQDVTGTDKKAGENVKHSPGQMDRFSGFGLVWLRSCCNFCKVIWVNVWHLQGNRTIFHDFPWKSSIWKQFHLIIFQSETIIKHDVCHLPCQSVVDPPEN